MDASCNVAIINYLINLLFCQVDITLNGKKITPSVATHSWRSIFEVLLNFGKDKSTHLETSGFKKDTAHKLDNIDNQNAGYVGKDYKFKTFRTVRETSYRYLLPKSLHN